MNRIFLSIVLSLAGLLGALALGEIALRLMSPPGPHTAKRAGERPRLFFMPAHAPTLQDQAFSLERSPDSFRIAVIGDSFSFAPQMQFDDGFSKRLERFLNLNSLVPPSPNSPPSKEPPAPKLRAEVLNFGTPGFSTVHEITSLDEALRYAPDIILLQITLNDAQLRPFNMEPLELQRKFGKAPLDVESSLLLKHSRLARWIAERIHNQQSVQAYIDYHYQLFENPDSGGAFRRALDTMRARVPLRPAPAAESGAVETAAPQHSPILTAVIFPLFDFPLDDSYPFKALHQKIGEELTKRGIPFLDLLPRFRGLPIERLQLIPGRDTHPNEIAHRIAAEQLLTWLVRKKMIPEALVPERIFKRRDHVKEPLATLPFEGPKKNLTPASGDAHQSPS